MIRSIQTSIAILCEEFLNRIQDGEFRIKILPSIAWISNFDAFVENGQSFGYYHRTMRSIPLLLKIHESFLNMHVHHQYVGLVELLESSGGYRPEISQAWDLVKRHFFIVMNKVRTSNNQ